MRAFNINNLRAGNIQDWKWESALDNFRNAMYAIDDEEKTQLARDSESIEEIGLVFEHYEHEKFLNARVNVNEVAVPSISLTPDTDWWNIQVGDRKNISIISAYDWLLLQYQGVIQQRRIAITGN
ncbi:MAG: hypothetical protein LBU27_08785, partial [Candidatus Peribacteria bacterium]|nr:hypothetical protein [Candidatus Peribacteria bacterium]